MKTILVVDYGSQFAQIIARRLRELEVYVEVCSFKNLDKYLAEKDVIGLVLSGGPNSVYEDNAPSINPEILNQVNVPILGVCYGAQLIAHIYGFKVEQSKFSEYGNTAINVEQSPLTKGVNQEEQCYMSHNDKILELSKDFQIIASTPTCPVAAFKHKDKNLYGVQFHPEVEHTPFGMQLFTNFVYEICKAEKNWTNDKFIQDQMDKVKAQIGDKKAICALSGGVDSSVAATLVQKVIGDNLTCIYVDSGLMRKNESAEVMKTFKEERNFNLIKVDAKELFFTKLKGVTDPETKRKIIGELFIRIFEKESKKIPDAKFLVQGTIYSDVVESGTEESETIKSHHNVGGLPKDMELELVEPIKMLFKDEVRRIGLAMGVPEILINRQPFPGPGLAIRVLGEITEEKVKLVKESDAILREEFANHGLDKTVWQYFTVCPGIKSVGVMGDGRTYNHAIAIRAVISSDGMTASAAEIPYNVLNIVSTRIVNEVKGVNRVLYDITTKPPASIEWE